MRWAPERSVLHFLSPELSACDRLFVERYVAFGGLPEELPEYYPKLTLDECRAFWARAEIRAECTYYLEIADIENARPVAMSGRLDPVLLKARIVENVENAVPGAEKTKALELALVVLDWER